VAPIALKSAAGGGSTPNISYPGFGLVIKENVENLDSKLRKYNPPIIIRRGKGLAIIDLSTVLPEQDRIIIEALKTCLS